MNGIKFRSAIKAAFVAAAMFAAPAAVAFVSAPSADAAAGTSVLIPGERLYAGQSLVNGQYTLAMQTDGNFVLYAGNQSLWQSHTFNNPNAWAVMQTDGNLVVYSPGPTNVHALWQSGTYNQPGDRLVVQPDGNAVIYNSNYTSARWATNTSHPWHHFRIELKAWIPQPYVADPFDPLLTPGINPSSICGIHLATASRFLGDNYSSFDGGSSARGSRIVDFNWDGSRITNFTTQVVLGVTHRVIAYSDLFSSGSCIQAQQASDSGFGTQTGPANVSMAIQTSNPLIPGSPAIHATMNIAVSADGTLNIDSQTTFFPSIGFRVTRDAQTSATDVVNDASCLSSDSVLGLTGLANLSIGLLNFNNGPDHVVVPSGAINQTMTHRDWLLCH